MFWNTREARNSFMNQFTRKTRVLKLGEKGEANSYIILVSRCLRLPDLELFREYLYESWALQIKPIGSQTSTKYRTEKKSLLHGCPEMVPYWWKGLISNKFQNLKLRCRKCDAPPVGNSSLRQRERVSMVISEQRWGYCDGAGERGPGDRKVSFKEQREVRATGRERLHPESGGETAASHRAFLSRGGV